MQWKLFCVFLFLVQSESNVAPYQHQRRNENSDSSRQELDQRQQKHSIAQQQYQYLKERESNVDFQSDSVYETDLNGSLVSNSTSDFSSKTPFNGVDILLFSTMTEPVELELPFQNDQSFISRYKRSLKGKELQIAVLAPQDPSLQYSLQKILPPIHMAVMSEQVSQLLPNRKITVRYRDTKCSSTDGPLAAFDFYINQTAGQFPVEVLPFPAHSIFDMVLSQAIDFQSKI